MRISQKGHFAQLARCRFAPLQEEPNDPEEQTETERGAENRKYERRHFPDVGGYSSLKRLRTISRNRECLSFPHGIFSVVWLNRNR